MSVIGVSGSRCVQAMLKQGTWNYCYLSPNQLIRKLIGCDWVWQYFLWPSLLFYSAPDCVLPSITVNMKYWGRCLFLSRIIYYLVSQYFRIQSYIKEGITHNKLELSQISPRSQPLIYSISKITPGKSKPIQNFLHHFPVALSDRCFYFYASSSYFTLSRCS